MGQLFYQKECSSTNDEISQVLLYEHSDFIGLHTFNQTKGRGQYGNTWMSTAEKNIAYSLAVKTENFTLSGFSLNYYTAIVIKDFLANLTGNEVKIKWPNDIILKNKKIVGILIEKKKIHQNMYYIIGSGVNVLQEEFNDISKAGSLLTQTGMRFDLDELASRLHLFLIEKLNDIPSEKEILDQFNENLFRKNEVSVFEIDKERQNGIIKYADGKGRLWLEMDGGMVSFDYKEIKLLY